MITNKHLNDHQHEHEEYEMAWTNLKWHEHEQSKQLSNQHAKLSYDILSYNAK